MTRVAVAVVAALAIAGGLTWRASYQPLSVTAQSVEGGDTARPTVTPGFLAAGSGRIAPPFVDTPNEPLDESEQERAVAPYADGAHVVVAYALHNGGKVGVRITGFDGPPKFALLSVIDVRVGGKPFRPFTLGGGRTRIIVVRERMHACEYSDPGTINGFELLGVRYRVLSLTRHTDLVTPLRVQVKIPDGYVCPRAGPKS